MFTLPLQYDTKTKYPLDEIFEAVKEDSEFGKIHSQTLDKPLPDYLESKIYGKEKVFSSFYGIESAFYKTFHYLADIAVDPFFIEVDGKKIEFLDPPKNIIISKMILRQYNCLDYGCSKCCTKPRFWNVFSKNQYLENLAKYANDPILKEIYNGNKKTISVNGKEKDFYVEDHTNTFCDHLDQEGQMCRIHEHNPIHCALPLTKFKRIKDTTYVTKEYFGRNWNMKCPARFEPLNEEGFNGILWMLNRVKAFADEMDIKTRIDEIIKDVYSLWENEKKKEKANNVNLMEFI